MSIIKVNCVDQTLVFENTPVIASGGLREDFVAFSFCPLWAGYYKTAVFWRDVTTAYHMALDETNSCEIPPEVLAKEGIIHFGVFGVNNAGDRRTSNVLHYNIELGAITEGTQPSDPTPELYDQLLAAVASLGDNKGKADKVESATAGNLAGLDANGNLTDSGKKPSDFLTSTQKGQPLGLSTLDAEGKVPAEQLPSMDYIQTKEKGVAEGVATLDATGKVPEEQLPEMAEPDDPFAWRTVEIVRPDFKTVTSIVRISSSTEDKYFDLPVPMDFAKYMYEFELQAFGLQQRGRTSGFVPVVEVYPYSDQDGAGGCLADMVDTEGAERSTVLMWPSFAKMTGRSDVSNRVWSRFVGYERNEWQDGTASGVSNDPSSNVAFDKLKVDFAVGSSYTVETFGILFSYRAYAEK